MKQFKDPIYGYIDIPRDIVSKIIDTPEFQRLRYIKQTSYLPVYSAALHNRFIHSLGVYFLGRKASCALYRNSKQIIEEYSDINIKFFFELACLLHDVRHAPFSHSGEDFYIDKDKTIFNKLIDVVNDSEFKEDVQYYHSNGKTAAPHEIMSVIVSLKQFESFFYDEHERSFFARCITGYKYRDAETNIKHSLLNAFITLLNSTTIDVDRLDYLIRDAFVMGYNSISIDYNRLLNSVLLVKIEDSMEHSPIQLAYHKSALSVIENVIYAHDSEKKWIQNHPVIQYEVFLIQQLLSYVKSKYKKVTGIELFSLETLLPTDDNASFDIPSFINVKSSFESIEELIKNKDLGKEISEKMEILKMQLHILDTPLKISLLCDDDIIYLAKKDNHIFAKELFNRSIRRHPIWKSESEYKICLDGFIGNESYDDLQSQIKILKKFLDEEAPLPIINNDAIEFCKKKLEYIPQSDFSEANKADMEHRYSLLLRWLNAFKRIKEKHNLKEFEFVIVPTTNFESGFKKEDLSKTLIYFSDNNKTYTLNKLVNLFKVQNTERHDFFYVYYKRSVGERIDSIQAGKEIARLVLE